MSFGNSNRELVDRWPQTDPLEALADKLKAAKVSATAMQLVSSRRAYAGFRGEIEGIVKALAPLEGEVIKVIREQLEAALTTLEEELGETK